MIMKRPEPSEGMLCLMLTFVIELSGRKKKKKKFQKGFVPSANRNKDNDCIHLTDEEIEDILRYLNRK